MLPTFLYWYQKLTSLELINPLFTLNKNNFGLIQAKRGKTIDRILVLFFLEYIGLEPIPHL